MKSKFVILILVIGVAIGGYAYFNKPSSLDLNETVIKNTDLIPTESYTDSSHNLTFKYPKNFTVRNITDEQGDVILIEDISNPQRSIQIRIQQMDEDIEKLDEARIRQDLPDLVINEPKEVVVGSGGKGLSFLSDNESFGGASREIWFVFKRAFYQVSSYKENDPLVQAVLKTWIFE